MNSRIRWLRIAYWTGAILDALSCLVLTNSNLWAALNEVPNFHADWDFRYAQSFSAVFMAAWTMLLVWADRKPLERRDILAFTVFPVVIGLNAVRYLLYQGGLVPVPFTTFGIVLPIVLTTLFLSAYFYSFTKPSPAHA